MNRAILRHINSHLNGVNSILTGFSLIGLVVLLLFGLFNNDFLSESGVGVGSLLLILGYGRYQAWKVNIVIKSRAKELQFKINQAFGSNQPFAIKRQKLSSLNSSMVRDSIYYIVDYEPYIERELELESHSENPNPIHFPKIEAQYERNGQFLYGDCRLDLECYRRKLTTETVLEICNVITYPDKYYNGFQFWFWKESLVGIALSTWKSSRMPTLYLCAVRGTDEEWLFITNYELALMEKVD